MNKIEKMAMIGFLGIDRTEFQTIAIPAVSLERGMPLGIGKCTAVILRLNLIQLNALSGAAGNAVVQVYYGDRNSQLFELIRGSNSELIICKDLSEIYIRTSYTQTPTQQNFVQAMIYHNDGEENG